MAFLVGWKRICVFPKKILQLRSFLGWNNNLCLRAEVKVESSLESVEGQLAWGEEPLWGGGGGGLEEPGVGSGRPAGLWAGLGGGGAGAGSGGGTVTGQVSGQKSGVLVGGVEGVDEGVEALAAGAVGDERSVKDAGDLGGELGAVLVEAEVAVGGVVGVDEGVEVGVDGLVVVLGVVRDQWLGLDGLRGGLGLGSGAGGDLDGGGQGLLDEWGRGGGGDESGGVLASGWDVGAVEDPESVLAGRVLDGVGLSVVSDVGVLSDPVSALVGLLAEEDLVLGGEGGAGAAVAVVEPLLLQDLGVPLVKDLAQGGRHRARKHDKSEHFDEVFVVLLALF